MAEFYMRDIRAWKDATILLSFEERGYFDEIVSLIYLYNGCLPDDDELICRAMPVNKKVHLRLKKALTKKGVLEFQDGFYFNSRSTQELLKINSKSTQNKLAAEKRWSKRLKTNEMDDANAIPIVKDESEDKDIDKSISKKPPKKIARRIENEFKADRSLPDKYREFAISENLPNPERVWDQFFDYWKGAAGKNACKLDWLATWRRWVRENIDRGSSNCSSSNGQGRVASDATLRGAREALARRRAKDGDIHQQDITPTYG